MIQYAVKDSVDPRPFPICVGYFQTRDVDPILTVPHHLILRPPPSSLPSNRRGRVNNKKVHHTITVQQDMILKSLWDWRDQMARQVSSNTMPSCCES